MNPATFSTEADAENSLAALFLQSIQRGLQWTPLAHAAASQQSIMGSRVLTPRGELTVSYEVIEGTGDNGECIPVQSALTFSLRDHSGRAITAAVPQALQSTAWKVLERSHALKASGISL